MTKVGLVVDSTCDMTPEWLAQHDIAMVPLTVFFGEESFLDWVDLKPDEFYEKLKAFPGVPKTSQPSPADFEDTYAALVAKGSEEIVSIHLSGPLSGTVQSATIAAASASVPVHVVDTKLVSQGMALPILEAMHARDRGATGAEVATAATDTSARTRLYFLLDTLEYLVKGGRAGKAQALAASLLNIKPVLEVNKEGIVEPFKKIRGDRQAMQALAQTVIDAASTHGRLNVAVLNACQQHRADQLIGILTSSGADIEVVSTGLVGAVIGTYAGPGAVGVAYCPARS